MPQDVGIRRSGDFCATRGIGVLSHKGVTLRQKLLLYWKLVVVRQLLSVSLQICQHGSGRSSAFTANFQLFWCTFTLQKFRLKVWRDRWSLRVLLPMLIQNVAAMTGTNMIIVVRVVQKCVESPHDSFSPSPFVAERRLRTWTKIRNQRRLWTRSASSASRRGGSEFSRRSLLRIWEARCASVSCGLLIDSQTRDGM